MTATLEVYRIIPPGDDLELVGTFDDDDLVDSGIRIELNGVGAGHLTIAKDNAQAVADVLQMGNLVKVTFSEIDTDPIFGWFIETSQFVLIDEGEEAKEVLTFGGRGTLAYWDRAVWLADAFPSEAVDPWWPSCYPGEPPSGTRGVVVVQKGSYRAYTVAGSPAVITGYTDFQTNGFCAAFDTRQTYVWPGANSDGTNSKRFLVHITDGQKAGTYFHPHQDGVREYLSSRSVETTIIPEVNLGAVGDNLPGRVLAYLFEQGQATDRPTHPIPLMTADFDGETDSNGDAWNDSDALAGLTSEIGEYFIETLGKLVGTGALEVQMGPDLDCHAYNHFGVDRTSGTFGAGKVRFVKGVNIADQLERERTDGPIATFAQVAGMDQNYANVELPDAADRIAREIHVSGGSDETEPLQAVGLAALEQRLRQAELHRFTIANGDDEANGLYMPGPVGTNGHFWVGDLVRIHTGTDAADLNEEDARVGAIEITEEDAGNMVVIIEIGEQGVPLLGPSTSAAPIAAATSDGGCGGCPGDFPFVPGTPVGHWKSGSGTFLSDNYWWMQGPGAEPANGTITAIGDDPITLVNGVTYHWHFEIVVAAGDETVGGIRFGMFGVWTTWAFGEGVPAGPGSQTMEFDVTPAAGDFTATVCARANATSHIQKVTSVSWWLDPDGWDPNVVAEGGGLTEPEPGQKVPPEVVVFTDNGDGTATGTTSWPFNDASFSVDVQGTNQTGAVIGFDGECGDIILGFVPRSYETVKVTYQRRSLPVAA